MEEDKKEREEVSRVDLFKKIFEIENSEYGSTKVNIKTEGMETREATIASLCKQWRQAASKSFDNIKAKKFLTDIANLIDRAAKYNWNVLYISHSQHGYLLFWNDGIYNRYKRLAHK